MSFTLTDEQQAIVAKAQGDNESFAVIARAGAAKTTTLEKITFALPDTAILCLAFNKAIATEMSQRIAPNAEAKTIHSLAFRAWNGFYRRKTSVVKNKVYQIVKLLIDELDDEEEANEARKEMSNLMKFISLGKSMGWIPSAAKLPFRSLFSDDDFIDSLPRDLSPLEREIVFAGSQLSAQRIMQGELDFDDMILAPALHPSVTWPTYPLVMIDEAQDLSPLNHYVLKKVVRKNRLIAVGDPLQAIYGFRGADTKSMSNLISMFGLETFPLTITFRCGKEIAANAHWRAPDLRAADSNVPGEVLRPVTWSAEDINNGDALICRNNAPLFSMAIKLIAEGKLPKLKNNDVGVQVEKLLKKLGKPSQLAGAARDKLTAWREAELRRARDGAAGRIHDMDTCCRIMLSQGDTLGDAIAYLRHLLNRDGRIHLMTGHGSKGLEFDNVFFLDQQLCNPKYEQDMNLKYVIETRAKNRLVYVTSETFVATSEED